MKKSILVIIAAVFITVACSKGGDGGGGGNGGGNGGGGGGGVNCTGVPASFSANVNQIIQTSCATDAACHGSGSANGPGPLLTYTQISNARVAIKNAVANGTMPQNGSLSTAHKNSIICWVDGGGLNN